jgi:MFS family permease
MFVVGGMVGAMGGGYVADRLGRRRGLIFAQVSRVDYPRIIVLVPRVLDPHGSALI